MNSQNDGDAPAAGEAKQKTVLITGGSSGIGLATALEASHRGWTVFAGARNPPASDDSADSDIIRRRIDYVEMDVRDPESIQEGLKAILSVTGRLDALVANAGIMDYSFFADAGTEPARRVMETNYFGVLNTCEAAIPVFLNQGHGRIIVTSSANAYIGVPSASAYCASKWAIEAWAESVAAELTPFGIDVGLIEPGLNKTNLWRSASLMRKERSTHSLYAEIAHSKAGHLLEKHGRDPKKTAKEIISILGMNPLPFRNSLGPDAKLIRLLSIAVPYALRRPMLARAIGLPKKIDLTCTEAISS